MVKLIAFAIVTRPCTQNASGTSSRAGLSVSLVGILQIALGRISLRRNRITGRFGELEFDVHHQPFQRVQTKPRRVKHVLITFGIRLACQVACLYS